MFAATNLQITYIAAATPKIAAIAVRIAVRVPAVASRVDKVSLIFKTILMFIPL
jgi:hypothetical protein